MVIDVMHFGGYVSYNEQPWGNFCAHVFFQKSVGGIAVCSFRKYRRTEFTNDGYLLCTDKNYKISQLNSLLNSLN
jgi:hypothetical protein